MVCCAFVIFGWAVPSTMALDALPGPSPRVCVLGLLLCRGCHVMCPCAVPSCLFCWAVHLAMALDAPPGPPPIVCVLGLLLCRWCYVMWPCAVLFFLFCWAVPLLIALDAPPGPSPRVCVLGRSLPLLLVSCCVCKCRAFSRFMVGCAPGDGS